MLALASCTPKNRTPLEKLNRIRKTVNSSQEDWREAKRTYDNFKSLRAYMGKPVVNKIDPKKIRRDLSGNDFFLTS